MSHPFWNIVTNVKETGPVPRESLTLLKSAARFCPRDTKIAIDAFVKLLESKLGQTYAGKL